MRKCNLLSLFSDNRSVLNNIVKLRDYYTHYSIKIKSKCRDTYYSAYRSPYTLLQVDPNQINFSMKEFNTQNRKIAGSIIDGNWDKDLYEFRNQDGNVHFHTLDSFEKHFVQGKSWENTKFYNKLLSEVQSGNVWWECQTKVDVEKRCDFLDGLYESIKQNGYLTQSEIKKRKLVNEGRSRHKSYNTINGEIAVNIGRNGKIIFYDGRNRLSIAKILNLDTVPVVVLVRHQKWQNHREHLYKGIDSKEEIKKTNHPDLINIT